MNWGILIPLAPFLMVAAIVIVPAWLRTRERREMQATVRAAIEKGQPLPPELVEALSKDVRPRTVSSAHRDMRIGVILLFVSGGVALTGIALGQINDNAMFGTVSGAAIPGMIGLAFIILSFFNPNKRPPEV
ncbi:DUF6249 domain-containing protein [Caulobacter sp. BE254]|uniref:DUF6249 domain-containing protein n=1 Tax=Caulobacter sp. BE254 TaxID=2817720 RepID=UPI00285C2851|nr:DUF6249 domain-containing protein [Caulobacter sp. BE254]MDR7114330.1 hypothetical protein [Caulobacter sp. BE254]